MKKLEVLSIIILSYIFRTSAVIGAVYMAVNNVKGWGLLILLALVTAVEFKSEEIS